MKRPNCIFDLTLGFNSFTAVAKTPGDAARQAFRAWIARGAIKRQPQSDEDGWFDGVTCAVRK